MEHPQTPTPEAWSNPGIEPFRFRPHPEVLEGAAFSRSFQAITVLIVVGSGYWLLSLWQQGKFGGDTGIAGL